MISRLALALSIAALSTSCEGTSPHATAASSPAASSPANPVASPAPPQQAEPALTTLQAQLGKSAPDFTLTDTDGKQHTLSALRGKTVVLEWFNPDCPFVKHAHSKGPLVDLAKQRAKPSLVWLAINSSAPQKQGHGVERNQSARQGYAMSHPVLLDETGKVGRAYGAIKTPHMFVIDAEGVLVYQGGLDNAPMGVVDDTRPRPGLTQPGSLVPYVSNVLDDLAANRPVSLAQTPAYGCSVKYVD